MAHLSSYYDFGRWVELRTRYYFFGVNSCDCMLFCESSLAILRGSPFGSAWSSSVDLVLGYKTKKWRLFIKSEILSTIYFLALISTFSCS